MEDFTCIVASHLSSEQRLQWLQESLDSCLTYFSHVILSISYTKDVREELIMALSDDRYSSSLTILFSEQKRTQFQHIDAVTSLIRTKWVIFMDDDDKFMDPEESIITLRNRYGKHIGIQYLYDDDGEEVLVDDGQHVFDADFSGTFCKTSFFSNG